MKKQAVGIIGGMGPEASQYFYGLLIEMARNKFGAKTNALYPEIYLASIPVPDFISNTKDIEKAKLMLVERILRMEGLDIGFYCMACNTGHILIDDLRGVTDKPFVSLLETVPAYLNKRKLTKVGLMATPVTIKMGLYQRVLNKVGIETVVPNNQSLIELGKIIKETVTGMNKEYNTIEVQKIARELLDNGSEAIIETCTEIPLIFPKQHLVPVYDSLEILAEAVLKRYYGNEGI